MAGHHASSGYCTGWCKLLLQLQVPASYLRTPCPAGTYRIRTVRRIKQPEPSPSIQCSQMPRRTASGVWNTKAGAGRSGYNKTVASRKPVGSPHLPCRAHPTRGSGNPTGPTAAGQPLSWSAAVQVHSCISWPIPLVIASRTIYCCKRITGRKIVTFTSIELYEKDILLNCSHLHT